MIDVNQYILSGNMEKAIREFLYHFPEVAKKKENIGVIVRMYCQCLIEMIRNNRIHDALAFAQEHLSEYTKFFVVDSKLNVENNNDYKENWPKSFPNSLESNEKLSNNEKQLLAEDDQKFLLV